MSLTHHNLHVVLGPPGTGKTTSLLSIMEQELADGTAADRIAYVTFTRKGVQEAKDRAMGKFSLTNDDLPWFRTIHSLAFKQMGYKKGQVIGGPMFTELGKRLGVSFTGGVYSDEGMISGLGTGDKLVFLESLARVTGRGLRAIWEESDHNMDWQELAAFARSYRIFKSHKGLVDFTDILEAFIDNLFTPTIEVLIIDEAQDLSHLQWACVAALAKDCRVVYVAGDDDQAIYRWAGADVEAFIALEGETRVLDQSFRIGQAVHAVASSVVRRIRHRKDKPFRPRDAQGSAPWVSNLDELDLTQGTWLLLARNSYMLGKLEEHCLWAGVNFDSPSRRTTKNMLLRAVMTWERLRKGERLTLDEVMTTSKYFQDKRWAKGLRNLDSHMLLGIDDLRQMGLKSQGIWHESLDAFPPQERDYFISLRMRGEKLLGPARIKIATVHAVKGGQADNVLLMTDISMSAYNSMVQDADDELRVMYVGMTRARENLFLMTPQTNLAWEI